VAGWVQKHTARMLGAVERVDATLLSFVTQSVRYTILILVMVAVLAQFGVQTTSIIAVLGAAGLAVGLALQGTLANIAFNDLLTNKASNDTASDFARKKIRQKVNDPEVADLLTPTTHPIGTKRLILDTNYYETYNRDNVTLVDIKSAPIEEITRTGLRTAQAGYELDAIVFATGFDAMTGAMLDIDIRVEGGPSLKEAWSAGPRTYLGLMIAGFPNLFTITGPGSPGVKSNMMLSIEQHTNWIVDCLQHLRSRHHRRIEVEPEAEESWVTHVREVADSTLYPLANSWYMGANIPGKPLVFMPYVGGVQMYKKKCDEVVANGYEGFSISG